MYIRERANQAKQKEKEKQLTYVMEKGTASPALLDDIVQRIVEVADPQKIILFGSAARGEMGPHSDVDLLVVKDGVHRRELSRRIYKNMWHVGVAVDIVVATPQDIKQYADCTALVLYDALQKGRVIYENA